MNTSQTTEPTAPIALVKNLDDSILKDAHALLDSTRVSDFSDWMDDQLEQFETQFHDLCTHRSVRKSLGR